MSGFEKSVPAPTPVSDDAVTEDVSPTPPAVVRIAELAGEVRIVDHVEGRTVGEYLHSEGIQVGRNNVVTVNGRTAGSEDILEPNSVVAVVGKVTNG